MASTAAYRMAIRNQSTAIVLNIDAIRSAGPGGGPAMPAAISKGVRGSGTFFGARARAACARNAGSIHPAKRIANAICRNRRMKVRRSVTGERNENDNGCVFRRELSRVPCAS
jgi:hypothetical protein